MKKRYYFGWLSIILLIIAIAVRYQTVSGYIRDILAGPPPTITPTTFPTATAQATATATPTATATATATSTATPSPTATFTPSPTATATPTLLPTVTVTPTTLPPDGSAASILPAPELGPDDSPTEGRLLVGLYGTPAGRGLGILGRYSVEETISLTLKQAAEYQALLPNVQVVPYFHMVVTIADAYPGGDGNYNHRVDPSTVQRWIDAARAQGFWSVVDIQPAHSPLAAELAYVEQFLRQPTVHLALDPEFVMKESYDIPGTDLGYITGTQINEVQGWLHKISVASGERKILVIHQFSDRMLGQKELLVDYESVELVWDADGFGDPHAKIADYLQYAGEPGYEYGGFKIFYRYDQPVMTPLEVISLEPLPVLVVYQ